MLRLQSAFIERKYLRATIMFATESQQVWEPVECLRQLLLNRGSHTNRFGSRTAKRSA